MVTMDAVSNASISIHAPLAGRDRQGQNTPGAPVYFNPRAPCGARQGVHMKNEYLSGFQSTRPLRGATPELYGCYDTFAFQSTRPLRGATSVRDEGDGHVSISIHAPLAGRDWEKFCSAPGLYISIHAPLAGRDALVSSSCGGALDFNPRAPCGARRASRGVKRPVEISIHAPLAGRDSSGERFFFGDGDFNPRAPCGARPFLAWFASPSWHFNPRAPCGARR